jgi:hypothetical protein
MKRSRLIQLLRDFPDDLDVTIEMGNVKGQISEVYEDPAYGVIFVAAEPDEEEGADA